MDTSQAITESLTPDRFKAAVISAFKNFVTFTGRSARWEFWLFLLFTILVSLVLGFVSASLYWLFSLICLLPSISLGIRRLHDTDRSGWWLLIAFIPLVGLIVLLYFACLRGTTGPNRFGADPLGGVPSAPVV